MVATSNWFYLKLLEKVLCETIIRLPGFKHLRKQINTYYFIIWQFSEIKKLECSLNIVHFRCMKSSREMKKKKKMFYSSRVSLNYLEISFFLNLAKLKKYGFPYGIKLGSILTDHMIDVDIEWGIDNPKYLLFNNIK